MRAGLDHYVPKELCHPLPANPAPSPTRDNPWEVMRNSNQTRGSFLKGRLSSEGKQEKHTWHHWELRAACSVLRVLFSRFYNYHIMHNATQTGTQQLCAEPNRARAGPAWSPQGSQTLSCSSWPHPRSTSHVPVPQVTPWSSRALPGAKVSLLSQCA